MNLRLLLSALLLPLAVLADDGKPPAAAIASAHHLATEAGHEILAAGGNAFDAAVAVSAALAVVEPSSSGLGGGGFWLLHIADEQRQVMIDGRETAPAASRAEDYLDEEGELIRDLTINGPLAAGIPGHPAALVHIAETYGRLDLATSLAPAIKLASEGFPIDEKYRRLMNWRRDVLLRYPSAATIFLDEGEIPAVGWTLRQPDLAEVLEAMAERGKDGFYKGAVAESLIAGVTEAGGNWTLADLAGYRVVEREPVRARWRGYEVVTASPPSSGGIALATVFNILNYFPMQQLDSTQQTHVLVEAMRRAYRDRSLYLGDPDFVSVPAERLTHRYYAAGLAASIRLDRATPSESLPGIESLSMGEDTSHFSLLDRDGNLVAATMSVNLPYGSGYVAPGTGLLLNNEMDDFAIKAGEPNAYGLIGDDANAIQPGKRMLSSMTPTFVIGEDRIGVLGTPGGSRIISMVLLGILEFMDGKPVEDWVSRPRIHHQYLPDALSIEENALDREQIRALRELGHVINPGERTWGNMQAVLWDRRNNKVSAASDPRWAEAAGAAEVR